MRSRRVLSLLALLLLMGLGAFFWRAHEDRRSRPGRIVRWCRGEGGAQQTVNDLVADLRGVPSLAQLQPWGIDSLDRFRAGQLRTNSSKVRFSMGTVRLAAEERPVFVNQQWGQSNKSFNDYPEISIRLQTNGQPECMIIAWYDHGIVTGPPGYQLSFQPWYSVQAQPGVYVYHDIK
jgi:hypothetical protein